VDSEDLSTKWTPLGKEERTTLRSVKGNEVRSHSRLQTIRDPLRFSRLCLSFLAAAVVTGCVTFPGGGSGILQDQIDQVISSPPLDQVNWGIRIVDPHRGQILYSRHAHLKFIPASNQKILGTAAALSLLGPEYRYETNLFGVGSIREAGSNLDGDLLLKASGDPTFSERYFPSSEAPLDSLAEGLWKAGIREVSGALVVDVSAWDSTTVPETWEVGDLPARFASTGGAFSIGEGSMTVEVIGGPEEGAPAQARWWPHLDEEFLTVGFLTVHPDSSTRGQRTSYRPESRRHRVEGKVRVAETDTIHFSQRDPVRLASRALLHAIEKRGIVVRGGLRVAWEAGEPVGPGLCVTGDECQETTRLAGLESPRLGDIVQGILEPSQNWMTEQLVRTLGAELGEKGSWEEGFRVQHQFFTQEVGIDSLDIRMRDGSGISAKNLVTPRALVRILDYMRDSPHAGVFRSAMASPGEEDSTLRSRLQVLENRVFAKTGTITWVNSLSGYLFTDSGRELIFSVLTNGSGLPAGSVRAAIDRIVEVVAGH
jgi:D-alanyl-D-alanine carboxypeptidase/D-alanyl-D-alanine-endopeptidase (penicillin-binding protein 4)